MSIGPSSIPLVPLEIIQTARRRQFNALQTELKELRKNIDFYNDNDAKSEEIKAWLLLFEDACKLELSDIQEIRKGFIELLQSILTDPLQVPLNKNARLGSDGNVYSAMTLSLCSAEAIKFEALPSTISHMCQWLEDNKSLITTDKYEQLHQELTSADGPLAHPKPKPLRPDPRTQLKRIREAKQKAEKQEAHALEEFRKHLQEDPLLIESKKQLILLNQEVENFSEATASKIDGLQKKLQQDMQAVESHLTHHFENTKNDQEELNQELTSIQQRIEELLDKQIEELEQNVQELRQKNTTIQSSLRTAAHESKILQQQILETKLAINKAKKKALKSILTTALTVGGCLLGTWAIQAALQYAGASFGGAVVPTKEGGAFLKAFFLSKEINMQANFPSIIDASRSSETC